MTVSTLENDNYEAFVMELDRAERAHMDWTHRVLRCAVLHTLPNDDVLKENAHQLCEFGHFLTRQQNTFCALDEYRCKALVAAHKSMHDAIRAISAVIFKGQPGSEDDLHAFETAQQELIEHLAHFKTLAVRRTAQTDSLTGLPLRHSLENDFCFMQQRVSNANDLLVMLADVDHFKSINDKFGHSAGDELLRHISNAMRESLREFDRIYRYGGEEFVILMHTTKDTDAQDNAAARILNAVNGKTIELPNHAKISTSVTIGLTTAIGDEPLNVAINRADKAMYEGKAAGRNCVVRA